MSIWTYDDKLDQLKVLVSSKFSVKDIYYEHGVLTFSVGERDVKQQFKQLVRELKQLQYLPTLMMQEDRLLLRIHPFQRHPSSKSLTPLLLFLATLGAVIVDGVIRVTGPIQSELLAPLTLDKLIFHVSIYAIILMAIIGLHELGHKLASKIDDVETSQPYFLPGIPGITIPTMGAVILQREPVVNRDDLFDIGISGPVVGFVVTVLAAVVAFITAMPASPQQITKWNELGYTSLPNPLLFDLIALFVPTEQHMIFAPVGLAAWFGAVLTSLNLLPVGQLDGGRVFRSVLSRRGHKLASYAAIGLMILTGWWYMAILLLLLMSRAPDVAPLDQHSVLSRGRRISFLGIFAMLAVTYVPWFTWFL